MKITQYNSSFSVAWNDFIRTSKQGTFMLEREYMDYHSERFMDNSLMFYEDEKLVAVLPANIKDGVLHSHQGLTYGGLIYGKKLRIEKVIEIFNSLIVYCHDNKIKEIIYKKIPYFYHTYPADEDRYAMFLNNFEVFRVDSSSTIKLSDEIKYSDSVKSGLRKAKKSNIVIKYDDNNFTGCFDVINSRLETKYNTSAVHTVEQMKMLKSRFNENIKLVLAYNNNEVVACVVLYITKTKYHKQYLATSEEGRNFGALDLLIDFTIETAKQNGIQYFDFGISNENGGRHLNTGLVYQKERFNARCICHEFFRLLLK